MNATSVVRSLVAAAFAVAFVQMPAAEAASPRAQAARPMSQVVGVRMPAAKAGVCSVPTPVATVSPSPIVLPVTLQGLNSVLVPFAIQNSGTGNLLVTGLSVDNPPCDCPLIFDVTDSGSCVGSTIPPGGSCTAHASFLAYGSPGTTWEGSVVVHSNDPSATELLVPISGTVGQAQLSVATSSLDLGASPVATPVTVPLGITNNGTLPLNVTAPSFYGSHASLYGATPGSTAGTCGVAYGAASFPFVLPVGGSCSLSVTFTPQAIGIFSEAYMYVQFNDGTNFDSEYVDLAGAGTGTGGTVVLLPASVNFGARNIGEVTSVASVTVRNLDSVSRSISGTAITPVSPSVPPHPFLYDASDCGISIAAGGSCVLQVWADATAIGVGSYSATVDITTDLGVTSLPIGLDVVPNLAWNPYTHDFGPIAIGGSAFFTYTLENYDPVPHAISLQSFSNPDFTITGGTCQGGSIPAAAGAVPGTCTATVTFTPSSILYVADNLIVQESTTGSPIYGYASGEGISAGPLVRLETGSLYFSPGLQGVSAQMPVVATNYGNQPTPTGLAFDVAGSPEVTVLPGTCSASLAAGGSCTFTVTYLRLTLQGDPYSNIADITVRSTEPTPTVYDSLEVYGTTLATLPAAIEAYPTGTLTFPPTTIGMGSTPLDVSLGNTGLGGTGLEITSIVSSSPEFVVTNDCPVPPSQLASQACCLASVTFQPTASGPRAGTLTVTTASGTITIALSGDGLLPEPPGVAVAFSPPSIPVGQVSTQTLTLSNPNGFPLTNVGLLDPFPAGIQVAATPAVTNTCGGTVTAAAGSASVQLSGGTIGAATQPPLLMAKVLTPTVCSITVDVVGTQSGTITNTIPAGNVTSAETTAAGVSSAAASGSLDVTGAQALPTALSFTPGTVLPGVASRFDLNVSNNNPAAFVDPDSFTYTLPAGLVIANPANAGLIGTACSGAISSANPGAASFTLAGFGVATGGACDFQVDVVAGAPGTYPAPFAAGIITGTVLSEPVANAAATPVSLTVTTAPAPVLTLTPAAPGPLDFGQVTIASSSSPWPVQVANTGNALLTFSGAFAVTGDYAMSSNTCGTTLPAPPDPASSCVANLVFTPTATGVRGGSFSVASNGGNAILNLTGEGLAQPVATISLSPASLAFASQTVGTTSAPQQVTVTSAGSAPLAISGVTVSGDFAVSTTCTSLSPLPPSATCPIDVTFSPVLAGTRVGQISIASNDPAAATSTVSLTGTAAAAPAPNVSLSPTSLAFPPTASGQVSASLSATLTNTGAAVLTIHAVELVGTGFTLGGDCNGRSLGTGETCTISAVFSPTSAGSYSADVRIVSNSPAGAAFLKLTGSATPAPVGRLSATPSLLQFGDQVLGTTSGSQPFTVINTGAAVLWVSRIDVTGDFAVEGTCYDLRPGESCVFRATFTPTVLGTRNGQVLFTSDAANSPFAVSFSGNGVPVPAPRVRLSASSLAWGNTITGTGSSQAVTVTNVGTLDLVVGTVAINGDFHLSNGCTAAVAPGQSCRIDVGFLPTIPGTRTGELRISTNAEGSPHGVSLSGMGCRFSIAGRSPGLVCAP